MEKIIQILMERDDYTREEAIDFYNEVMNMVNDAILEQEYEEAEEIFCSEFGLESDYIMDALL